MAPRVQGKIVETASGTRFLIVEQKGRDIFRGRQGSIHAAVQSGEAGLGVDKELLARAERHNVTVAMIVIEEQRRIFLAPLADFMDPALFKMRANWRGRAQRVLPYERYKQIFLGPSLRKRKSRAKQTA